MGLKEKEKEKKVNKKVNKKLLAKTMQELLPYEQCYNDGIIKVDKMHFSKLYKLTDSNFITEPENKQEDYLIDYSKALAKFPDNVDIDVVIVNKRNTTEELARSFHLKEKGEYTDKYCNEYNQIIDAKIKEGNNDIQKDKYIVLTVRANDYLSARNLFNSLDIELDNSIKPINKVGVKPVNIFDRLSIMSTILKGAEGIPFEEEFAKYREKNLIDADNNIYSWELNSEQMKKDGVSTKDLIVPQIIKKCGNYIQLDENRVCKTFGYVTLPESLDTSFLNATTNLPYEMVTTIHFSPIPKQKAIRYIKNANVSIKADVIKASQQAYKSGYSPDLMDEDLQQAKEEALELRKDVVVRGKKLYVTTMTVMIIGNSDKDLKEIENQFTMRCGDFSITPNKLLAQQTLGFKSSLLLGNRFIELDRMITSDDACALFPFNIQELMDKKGHFYGINAISKNMIMYDRKRSQLANGLIFGQAGSGKSFITKGEIIPNLLDGNDDMIILDPENEYREIANEFGGVVIDLEPKAEYHINPCDMSMEWDNPKASPLIEKCDFMVSLVESIMGKGRECNSFEVNAIHRATTKMYENYINVMTERKDAGNPINLDTEICPTLVDFYEELVKDGTPEATKISMVVESYCVGNYNLFAHKTDINPHSRLTVYNLNRMPEKMKEFAMKVCLSKIWNTIVDNKDRNAKLGVAKSIWVYLDEFHLFFQTESSATTIMSYFKRVRKYGGIMTGITQDVADLLKTQQGTAMFNNTGFFIFLRQSPVGRDQIQRLYNVSDTLIDYTKEKPVGVGLLYNGTTLVPINYQLPKNTQLYKLMSTNPNDKEKKEETDTNDKE